MFFPSASYRWVTNLTTAAALLALSACSGLGNSASNLPQGSLPQMPSSADASGVAQPVSAASSTRQGILASAKTNDPYAQTVLGDHPSAYYRLNDSTSTMVDSVNAINGTYGSAVTKGAAAIRSGAPAAAFPGGVYSPNIAATVGANQVLQPSNALSVEGWIEQSAPSSATVPTSVITYGGETDYRFLVSPSNRLTLFLRTTAGPITVSATTLSAGHPYHIVGTYDGRMASVYVNGQLAGSAAAHGTLTYASSYGLSIGGGAGSKLPSFHGSISDVSIYNRALSASQAQAHYSASLAGPAPTPAPTSSAYVPPSTGNYDATVLNDKALAFFRLSDHGSQLLDSVSGQAIGSYGGVVKLGGASLNSDGGSTAVFSGGTASPSTEALVTPAAQLRVTTGVSVEAWFTEPSLQPNQYIGLASYGSASSRIGWPIYGLHMEGNEIEFDVHPRNGGMSVFGPRLQPGVTYYAAGIYDGSKVSLYLNGQLVASKRAVGQFYYPSSGFSIGGCIGSSNASFNGSIGDVAVYGYPLSSTQVANHYLTGAATPMAGEAPVRANAFIDSIGVDTHFSQVPYIGPNQSTVISLLAASGIRHIREGMVGSVIPAVRQLAANGVRATYDTDLATSDATIRSWPSQVGNSFEAYEGPNEPNYLGGSWASQTRAFMQRLHNDVKGNPALAVYPILAPAVSGGETQLGDISALVDYGNMHDYFATFNPGTPGWGNYHPPAGVYGSLSYNVNLGRVESGSLPIIATETGYGSGPSGSANYLDDATASKYITRTFFVSYNQGVPRTFVYEFLDQDRSGRPFTNNGLVDLSLRPKPAYKALHEIITDLSDGGSSFSPTPLTYQLSGNLANVKHMLLQKSDGTYYLALWLEVQSWANGHSWSVPTQTVNVTTQKAMSSASLMQLDDSGNASTTSVAGMPGHTVSIPVTDRISLVHLSP